ncbi:MAG: DUF2244 domain-containing protein [Pseudomonadales bacterium]|nr:DUF2244 domain-containing protein [Pseudomonadales bacterium]
MINVEIDPENGTGYILLQPNMSASWRTNLMVVGFLTFMCTVVSSYMWYLGAVLVLPFAGAEVILLAVATGFFFHKNSFREVIHFYEDEVVIEKGRRYPERHWKIQRNWVQLFVRNADHIRYLPTVSLGSMGRSIEIGEFLNEEDKEELIERLSDLIPKKNI